MSYKEQLLSNLRETIFSSLSEDDISAQEIFDLIREETASLVEYHKNNLIKAEKFYSLITDFSYNYQPKKKWVLPVEIDGASGEYFLTLPDELLDDLKWEEGDELEYVDNFDGSFSVKKCG